MDNRQYVPGPPPLSQAHSNLPPPPPRPPVQTPTHIAPPPPAPYPGANYATLTGWQQASWGRAPIPPPPPLQQQQQYQHLPAYNRPPAPLSIVPPSQPLTSATYIPGRDTIHVGIPGLLDAHGRASYDPYAHATADRQLSDRSRFQANEHTTTPSFHNRTADQSLPQTPGGRTIAPPYVLHSNVHELTSNNGSPQAVTDLAKSTSHRYNISNASLGGLSPSEAATQWPIDRVLIWLAKNGFSNDWQETFKSLELQGADFLGLGLGAGGRGDLGKMHQVVYPELAKQVGLSEKKWEPSREREEGKRMRQLIRQIYNDSQDGTVSTPLTQSQPPTTALPESSTGSYFSYNIPEPHSAGPVPGVNDIAPEHLNTTRTSSNQKQKLPGQRSVTEPPYSGYESSPLKDSNARSEYSRIALAGINSDHRRQSPSVGSEAGTLQSSAQRPQDSPQSGSPAMQHISPNYATFSSSAGDLSLKYDHSRGNSTDSISGTSRPSTGRYYDPRRQGQEGARPSPQDAYGRNWSGEPSSYSREHGKSFFTNILRKWPKPDPAHPSPEIRDDSSPTTSPETRPRNAYLPYSKPGFNASDMSIGERPAHALAPTKTKKWVFVTMDGSNFRLIEVSEMKSVEALRLGICQNIGVDSASAQIYLTEPGQTEHEDAMSDEHLSQTHLSKSDAHGTLKLFVRGTPAHSVASATPRFDGLGVSLSEKSNLSPTAAHHQVHRKPLDEDALNRISPHRTMPDSPSFSSRQSTLKGPTAKASPADTTQDTSQDLETEKSDLLARHEEHMREVERKQKQYYLFKMPQSQSQQNKNAYGDTGYRRNEVIDFDIPRISPFEEKKGDPLVPLRKPPMAPVESNTLTKVNSLSRRPTTRESRTSLGTPVHGLGAALASVGRVTSAIGTPLSSVPAARERPADGRSSVGLESDRPGTVDSEGTTSSKTTLGQSRAYLDPVNYSPFSNNDLDSSRPSSKDATRPGLQSRKSFGPEFNFEENPVSFQRTSQPQEDSYDDSDDDSDDGLFQVRISRGQQETPSAPSESKSAQKPSLVVNTDHTVSSGPTVTFLTPKTPVHSSGGEAPDGSDAHSDGSILPENMKSQSNRNSFVQDVWANRPAVEGVIDHLDKFFPDVDLDTPYLDEPTSPGARASNAEHDANLKDKKEPQPPVPQSAHIATTPYGPGASAMRPSGASIVGQRRIAQSGGGLSRMKSIRQVAQGANRTKSVKDAGPQKSGDLLRRKSTKMFGAKIMQIRPRPGSRLSQLDPIPQHSNQMAPATGPVPQRQPTFRIIRGQLIGKGTYGRVYLGMNADNGEVLAVKLVEINARIAGADKDRIKEMVAALDQEIDTMQHLEHPNIVQYLGCERGELSISIYLEYISGGSVGSCLRKHGKFEESVVRSLTRQTLDGLSYLHDKGILHRDLKADNILLDLDGSCKISDFGISKKTDNIYGNDSSNSMQGTVFWMAPEVIQSQGQGYSAKVDIWSLGCVVLEMFAGRRPWSKEEAIGAIFKLGSLSQAPPIPEDVSLNISPASLAFMFECFTM